MWSERSDRRDGRVMRRPRIGLSMYWTHAEFGVFDTTAAVLPGNYLKAVVNADATPILLPPLGFDASVIADLDGMVVIGGPDVDPSAYGARPHPETSSDPARDAADLAAVHAALRHRVPLLAICRGHQVLNVALGGTLHQHLPEVTGSTRYQGDDGEFGRVEFDTEPGSLIRDLVGERAISACYHHQAIDRVADGLHVTARAADDVIEAVEADDPDAWVLGVQFHPEELLDDARLMNGLVAAARRRAAEGE